MAAHLSHPIFDGHNDALTRDGAPDLATRHDDGHLDFPRMREGGMRSGIFAVFTPSPDVKPGQVRFSRGVTAAPLAPPVGHKAAAAHASAAAERLLALERAGEVVVARAIGDVDGAREGSSAPVAVLHLEGAKAIDPYLEALGECHEKGLRSLGPRLEPRQRLRDRRPVRLPLVADRIGVEHVALGSDFDGATVPADLGDAAGLPKLLAALRETGFDDEELAAICWHNWRLVLAAWWR